MSRQVSHPAIISHFVGQVAAAPEMRNHPRGAVTKFVLMTNEYAGHDGDQARTRKVSIQFTAFGAQGEIIGNNAMVGDQLIVNYRIENNNFEKADGEKVYGYNFIVDSFQFGAPGKAKREQFANA